DLRHNGPAFRELELDQVLHGEPTDGLKDTHATSEIRAQLLISTVNSSYSEEHCWHLGAGFPQRTGLSELMAVPKHVPSLLNDCLEVVRQLNSFLQPLLGQGQ